MNFPLIFIASFKNDANCYEGLARGLQFQLTKQAVNSVTAACCERNESILQLTMTRIERE